MFDLYRNFIILRIFCETKLIELTSIYVFPSFSLGLQSERNKMATSKLIRFYEGNYVALHANAAHPAIISEQYSSVFYDTFDPVILTFATSVISLHD